MKVRHVAAMMAVMAALGAVDVAANGPAPGCPESQPSCGAVASPPVSQTGGAATGQEVVTSQPQRGISVPPAGAGPAYVEECTDPGRAWCGGSTFALRRWAPDGHYREDGSIPELPLTSWQ